MRSSPADAAAAVVRSVFEERHLGTIHDIINIPHLEVRSLVHPEVIHSRVHARSCFSGCISTRMPLLLPYQSIATASADRTICLWDCNTGERAWHAQ
jgi:hypothetical protein